MALTKSTVAVNNISSLSATPNATEGLTAAQLQAKFDKSASDNKTYINDTLTAEIDALFAGLLDKFYPVGTIYETTSTDLDTTTKMGTYFGGTWEVYGSGAVTVCKSADTEFDTIGETGGAKTHTLNIDEMPSHTHIIEYPNPSGNVTAAVAQVGVGTTDKTYGAEMTKTGWNGGNQAHNNMPPYIVVYRYRRTA